MAKYIKNQKDYEQYKRKEIDVWQYNGRFDAEDTPDWVLEALESGELYYGGKIYDNKDTLIVRYHCLPVRDGEYLVRKLPTRGYGDIAACSESFLHEYFDAVE